VAALLAALAIPVGVLLGRGGESEDFRGSPAPEGMSLPAFELEDDEGRSVRSTELEGKALAVTFLDVQCTDACPLIAAQVGQAVRGLGEERGDIQALAVSVDPVRDTPAGIDAFLRRYRAKGACATSTARWPSSGRSGRRLRSPPHTTRATRTCTPRRCASTTGRVAGARRSTPASTSRRRTSPTTSGSPRAKWAPPIEMF